MPDKVKAPFKGVHRAIVEQVARSIHELPEHVQALYYIRLRDLKWTSDRARAIVKKAFG
jgi:hypothetical protein